MKVLLLFGYFLAAALVIALANWLSLIPFRKTSGQHWTERARKLYPARLAAISGIWFVPVDLVLAQRLIWPRQSPHWLLAGFAAWWGAMSGTYLFDREVFPWVAPRDWLRESVTSWALRFAWLFVFFGIMAAMPQQVDWRTWALGAALIGVFAFWTLGGLLWSCKKIGLLQPSPERLSRLVAEVSARMNVPVRGVWMLRSSAAQAYALPYTGDLLFTRRLLDICPDNEITAICAHELGHLCESKFAQAGRLPAGFIYLPWAFVRPLRYAFGDWAFLILFALSWVSLIVARKHSRRLEVRADAIASQQSEDASTYAQALSRLYEANLLPAVMPKRRTRTHPDLYDRLVAVGAKPEYPRPKPANARSYASLFYSVALGLLFVPTLNKYIAQHGPNAAPEDLDAISQEAKPVDNPASDTHR